MLVDASALAVTGGEISGSRRGVWAQDAAVDLTDVVVRDNEFVGAGGLGSTVVIRGGTLRGTRTVPAVSGGDTIHAGDGVQALSGSRIELRANAVVEGNERAAVLLHGESPEGEGSSALVESTVSIGVEKFGLVVQQGALDPVDETDTPVAGVLHDPDLDVAESRIAPAEVEQAAP